MFEALFGAQLPLAIRFSIAFLIVLVVIVATFWAVRRLGGSQLGSGMIRGRQPRLAVIETAAVSGRRSLVLIRRDNVEHLVMIGGPSDIVIEQNILRAVPVATPRDVVAPRASGVTEAVVKTPESAIPPSHGDRPPLEPPHRHEPATRTQSVIRTESLARPEPPTKPRPSEPRGDPIARSPRMMDPRSHAQPEQVQRRSAESTNEPTVPAVGRPAEPMAAAKPAIEPARPRSRTIAATSEAELSDMTRRLESLRRRTLGLRDRADPVADPPWADEMPGGTTPSSGHAGATRTPSEPELLPSVAEPASEANAKMTRPVTEAVQGTRPEHNPVPSASTLDNIEHHVANLTEESRKE